MSKENIKETEEKEQITKDNKETEEKTGSTDQSSAGEAQADGAEKEAVEDTKSEEVDPIEKLQVELSESKDKYLRLYSEYENFRRRTAREKLEMMQTAHEDLMLTLLPVLDDFERATNSFSEDTGVDAIKEGIDLITQKFINALQQKGLKQMETKEGTKFDADLHEAITQIPAPKSKLKGKIVDTIEKGYYLGDKVIRHARVVIGN